jgi:hypothetical protein
MPAAASHLTAAGPLCLRPVPHRDTCEYAASGSAAHEAGNVWTLRRQLDFTPVPPAAWPKALNASPNRTAGR